MPESSGENRSRLKLLLWAGAFFAVLAYGLTLRLDEVSSRSLEYDEIWTFLNYVAPRDFSKIFNEVSAPNNHPVNTLLCLVSVSLFGNSFFALRIPVLLCGALIPPLAGLLSWRLFGSRAAALVAMALCSFNGGLIHYSQTARGYSIQSLFVLVSAGTLMLCAKGASEKVRRWTALAFFAGTVLSTLTLPTGVVFAGALAAPWLLLSLPAMKDFKGFVREERYMLSSFALCGVFFMAWFIPRISQFQSGQGFGTRIESAGALLSFMWNTLNGVSPWIWLLPLLAMLRRESRPVGVIASSFIGLSLLSAVAVKAGPDRVYLPMAPVIAIGAAGAICALSIMLSRRIVLVRGLAVVMSALFAAGAVSELKRWTPVDWPDVAGELVKAFDPSVYICYPAGDCYPILYNCKPWIQSDEAARSERFEGVIAIAGTPGFVSGIDHTLGRVDIRIPESVKPQHVFRLEPSGVDVQVFRLKQVHKGDSLDSRIVFVKMPSCHVKNDVIRGLLDSGWILLNPRIVNNAVSVEIRYRILATGSCRFGADEVSVLERYGIALFAIE